MLTLPNPPSRPLKDDVLSKAIELYCSPVFGALNMANALGGAQTDEWQTVRAFGPRELFVEAERRGLDFFKMKAACSDTPVAECGLFSVWLDESFHLDKKCVDCGCSLAIHVRGGVRESCARAQSRQKFWKRTSAVWPDYRGSVKKLGGTP